MDTYTLHFIAVLAECLAVSVVVVYVSSPPQQPAVTLTFRI